MKKITKQELSWAMYDWGNSAYSLTISSAVLPIYFKMVAENGGMSSTSSTAMWGYTISIATLIVALLAPIIGSLADFKGNKKKIFSFFFGLGVLSTAGLVLAPANQPILLLGIYVLTVIGFSCANNVYDALLVDVTSEERMDGISSLGFGLGYIGSTIPFIIGIVIVMLAQLEMVTYSVYLACKITFIITAIWWAIFTLPLLKNVKQIHYIEKTKANTGQPFKRLVNTFKEIKSHKAIFLFLIAYFCYIDGVDTIIGMASTFGTDLGISMTTLMIILLLTQFVAFPFTILYGRLSSRFGSKQMIYVGIITYTVICCFGYFINDAPGFFILAMAVGSAQGGIQAISRSYYAKLVPKEKSAEFFGFYNIFGRFAAILGPFLVGIVTQLTGRIQNGILSLIVLFIVGFITLTFIPETEVESELNELELNLN